VDGLDAHVDVDAARAAGLGEAEHPVLAQHVARAERDLAHLAPRHARRRVEVDAQLVGVVEVAAAHRPGVPVDVAQVDRPDQVRGVVGHELSGAAPGWEVHRGGLQPLRAVLGTRFWKNTSPVMPSFQRFMTVGRSRSPADRPLSGLEVVLDELELGDRRPACGGK